MGDDKSKPRPDDACRVRSSSKMTEQTAGEGEAGETHGEEDEGDKLLPFACRRAAQIIRGGSGP